MRNVSKTFPGVKALNNVQLKAWGGEVLALMGENGAGKSTLMKILSGAYQADAGSEILIDGQPVAISDPIAAKRLGVSIIYQELSLAPNLSVAENMFLGDEIHTRGLVNRKAMYDSCRPVLERLGAPFRPETPVGGLSIAEQQLVEIARALHSKSKILVLDEPTTALSSRETERLFALVRQLRADGIALIYISHRMAEVYELSDRVSVLRDGSYVGTLDREGLSADSLVKMMVGRDLSSFYKKEHDPHGSRGRPILEVKDVTDGGRRVKPCSFTLHQGEVLGIAGLVGSGRTELARLIYGADPKAGGEVLLEGRPLNARTPKDFDRRRPRLSHRGPQGAGPLPRHVLRREHQHRRDRPRRRPRRGAQPRHGQAALRGRVQGAARAGREPAGDGGQPLGRQPAEGAALALAGDRPQGADPGRADARRRHRRQVRDLPPHRRAGEARTSGWS